MSTAVKQNWPALEYADPACATTPTWWGMAVTQNGHALIFVNPALQSTGNAVLAAFLQDRNSLDCPNDALAVL